MRIIIYHNFGLLTFHLHAPSPKIVFGRWYRVYGGSVDFEKNWVSVDKQIEEETGSKKVSVGSLYSGEPI